MPLTATVSTATRDVISGGESLNLFVSSELFIDERVQDGAELLTRLRDQSVRENELAGGKQPNCLFDLFDDEVANLTEQFLFHEPIGIDQLIGRTTGLNSHTADLHEVAQIVTSIREKLVLNSRESALFVSVISKYLSEIDGNTSNVSQNPLEGISSANLMFVTSLIEDLFAGSTVHMFDIAPAALSIYTTLYKWSQSGERYQSISIVGESMDRVFRKVASYACQDKKLADEDYRELMVWGPGAINADMVFDRSVSAAHHFDSVINALREIVATAGHGDVANLYAYFQMIPLSKVEIEYLYFFASPEKRELIERFKPEFSASLKALVANNGKEIASQLSGGWVSGQDMADDLSLFKHLRNPRFYGYPLKSSLHGE